MTSIADYAAITVGMRIPDYRVRPSTVELFRFSATTWNTHRIHYDSDYARAEGYPDVLVQSHLHGCFLSNAVLKWAGPGSELRGFRWRNRHIAVAGDVLTVTGTVTAVTMNGTRRLLQIDLEEHNDDGALCVTGQAVVALPAWEGQE